MAGSHRTGARGRSGRRRARSRGSRLRAAGVTVVCLAILAVAAGGWYYHKLNGNISTFGSDGISRDRPEASAGGRNVLVIGSDSRSGKNKSFGGGEGDVGRSDTAFLLHVYKDRQHAVAVSFPRDALVDIPPCKLPDGGWTKGSENTMFNVAFTVGSTAEGNPACTQNTVEKLTGLRVDHTVVVDFAGFSAMTDAVGGVPVCVPGDVYQGDLNPNRGSRGKRIFSKGRQTVSGQKALDYVRIRHGIGDGSDIGRIRRQQAFVSSLIKKVKDKGLNPTTLLPLADAATKSMTVDEGLGTAKKMMDFAMSLKDVDLHDTKFVTLPWRYQGARVAVVQPDADRLWADLRADRTVDGSLAGRKPEKSGKPEPSESARSVDGSGVRVAVRNGTGITGLAARAAGALEESKFTVTDTGNASVPTTGTRVEYGQGHKAEAEKVARLFPGAEVAAGQEQGVTVTVGKDYADNPQAGRPTSTPDKDSDDDGDKPRSADDDLCAGLSYG